MTALPAVVAIFGPTASGKTAVAEALAERVPAELVSADAMQLYRGLPVLTNQSSRPTHLVGVWDLGHEGSVAEYEALAHRAIDGIVAQGRHALVVGGTGLYLRAALGSLQLPPPPEAGLRAELEALYEKLGPEEAHARLAARDAAAAARVHPNDRRRVVRALELAEAGGSLARADDTLWADAYRHPTLVVGLDVPRDELVHRIESRTQSMVERGVVAEARNALRGPVSSTASTIHGLREFGEVPEDEAVALYNRRVRRYAAYQRKWMRRIPGIVIIDADRPATEVADAVLEVARTRERLPRHAAARADA